MQFNIKRASTMVLYLVLILTVLFSLSACYSKTISETASIDNLTWRATAEIQEYKTCNESGWEIPEGAIVYDQKEEIKSYKVVGYETKYQTEEYQEHVGYYRPTWRPRYETRTRQVQYQSPIKEPVYATKYYYTIDKWVTSNIKIALAEGNTTDYSYPEYVCEENERISAVEYTYLVHFTFNGREVAYVVDKDKWESLEVGQELYIEENEYGPLKITWPTKQ